MKSEQAKTPEFLLEQLLLGEISASDERALRSALTPAEIDAGLSRLRADNARFEGEHDAAQMVTSIRNRTRVEVARQDVEKKRNRRGLGYVLPGVAAIACALVLFSRGLPNHEGRTVEHEPDGVRIKGSTHLVLYRRQGEQAETLSEGAHARRGDMLQVGYVAAEAEYGVIVSLDGQGNVTLHFPDADNASTRLASEGETLLGHAYELDAAPRFERFFFVTGKHPIDTKRVLSAAHVLAQSPDRAPRQKLELPPDLKQNSLTLVKE
jgi:hypothetical protein